MRRKSLWTVGIVLGAVSLIGCALSDEPGRDVGSLGQGLTVLQAENGHLALAYRSGEVVIFMEGQRGKATPELYQFDSSSPLFEIDARFTDADGFVFHAQQGGHGWLNPEWGEALKRQMAGRNVVVGSNEILFKVATQAAATLHRDIAAQIGAEQAAALAPEIDSLHAYAVQAHKEYRDQYAIYQRQRLEEGREAMPPLPETTGEITYGTPGPDDPYYTYTTATDYSIALHADKLDGIPGYAGGYHSATQRHAWSGGAIYWSHSTCNHGACAWSMTRRSGSSYKAFAASELEANHCSGEYKWDSDGGYYGHNCHDDSRIQMHNYAYKSTRWGTWRWCDGGDRDHDISVDILFVELDQEGYPVYSTSTNKGYGAL